MLGQLRTRFETTGVKPAVICVSSIASNMVIGIYSATKAFVSNLMRSLSYTSSYYADFLAFEPAEVRTKMIEGAHAEATQPLRINPEEAAEVCFRDLGILRSTVGNWKHYFVLRATTIFPNWLFEYLHQMGMKDMVQNMKKIKAEKEKENNSAV